MTVPPTRLAAIRRYPVKAMGGEDLAEVEVTSRGLSGDRGHAVTDAAGRLATGKDARRFVRHDEVFAYAARTRDDGVEVRRHDGGAGPWRAGDPVLDAALSAHLGASVRLLAEQQVSHFDDSPVSFVGTATLTELADRYGFRIDPRRIRVNLLLETDEPFVEEGWTGLHVGDVDLEVVKQITRCRIVDLDQDGVGERRPLLRSLGDRQVRLGVYGRPVRTGTIRVGDVVTAR